MGADSKIEWCDHTFNPWWGCTKVSEGCANCYAETLSNRFNPGLWGPQGKRRMFGDPHWREPSKWNRKTLKMGLPARVFCGSMCDIFEDHPDLHTPRKRLWGKIQVTESLTWLLLTKRPENIINMVPSWWLEAWPARIWIGTSVENQATADERIPHLLKVPAKIRFLSVEPLLGPVDLTKYLAPLAQVIVGGESGPGARPMHPDWARSIRDQCKTAGVPFFMKQMSRKGPIPDDLMIREFPKP